MAIQGPRPLCCPRASPSTVAASPNHAQSLEVPTAPRPRARSEQLLVPPSLLFPARFLFYDTELQQ